MFSNSSELEIARATDTSLQPEQIPNQLWFEEEFGKLIARMIHSLSERTDLSTLSTLLSRVCTCLELCGRRQQLDEGLLLSRICGSELDRMLGGQKFEDRTPERLKQSALRIALYDLEGLGLISILVGLAKTFRETTLEDTVGLVDQFDWQKLRSLYPRGHRPRSVVEEWESLRELITFEIEVEGKITSPNWLLAELTALGFAKFIAHLGELVGACEQFFGQTVKKRVADKDMISATQIALRGLEATNKLKSHFATFKAWHEGCERFNRSNDWKWPAADWVGWSQRIDALRVSLVRGLAVGAPYLWQLADSKLLPDLFGQTYSVLADSCFDALLKDDEAEFAELFPVFFTTALFAHDRIIERNRDRSGLFKLAVGPLGDLLAVSGYAVLASELTGRGFTKIATDKWDSYFAGLGGPEKIKRVIGLLAASTDVLLGTSPRELLRFAWKRAFNAYLASKGFRVGRGFYYGEEPDRSHPSPIVRAYVPRADMMCDGEDVFLALHIFRRAEADGIKMPDNAESFDKGVKREIDRKENEDETES